MPEFTLDRVSRDRYTLGDVGTLRALRRFAAEIEAGSGPHPVAVSAEDLAKSAGARAVCRRLPVARAMLVI
jgi:hypothetical protein